MVEGREGADTETEQKHCGGDPKPEIALPALGHSNRVV